MGQDKLTTIKKLGNFVDHLWRSGTLISIIKAVFYLGAFKQKPP